MFWNSSEKIEVRFTEISNVTVITRVQINKKGADLFIKGIFRPKQCLICVEIKKLLSTFKLQKKYSFIDTTD